MASVFETSAGLTVLPSAVARQFDLTESESRLCLGLVQGKSLDDIAEEYSQPRQAMRDQFGRLLVKTGTDTEAKLVTILLSRTEMSN